MKYSCNEILMWKRLQIFVRESYFLCICSVQSVYYSICIIHGINCMLGEMFFYETDVLAMSENVSSDVSKTLTHLPTFSSETDFRKDTDKVNFCCNCRGHLGLRVH